SAMLTASTGKILIRSPHVGVRPLLVATFHHYAFNRGTALGVQNMSESRMAGKTRRREPAGLRELNQKQWVAGLGCSMAALLSCRGYVSSSAQSHRGTIVACARIHRVSNSQIVKS